MNRFLKVIKKRLRLASEPWRLFVADVRRIRDLQVIVLDLHRQLEEHRRDTRLMYSSIALPRPEHWSGLSVPGPHAPAQGVAQFSTLCRQADFSTSWFAFWAGQVEAALLYHRKLWEYVFICQALWERGALAAGMRGLGFGCGTEPLPARFASFDCSIVATDISAEAAALLGWADSLQHTVSKETLRRPRLCADDTFERNVEFRHCDMNRIPNDLTGFDFCWSSCALEHLGSIENGLAFIERSILCLKPGGWAVHTTEFNLSSNDETVDDDGTVLFRRRDFEALAERLAGQGHFMAPLNFDPATGIVDSYLDVAPYRENPSLKLALLGFATTSFGIIVRRGP